MSSVRMKMIEMNILNNNFLLFLVTLAKFSNSQDSRWNIDTHNGCAQARVVLIVHTGHFISRLVSNLSLLGTATVKRCEEHDTFATVADKVLNNYDHQILKQA